MSRLYIKDSIKNINKGYKNYIILKYVINKYV